MVNKTKSQMLKRQIGSESKTELRRKAAIRYQKEQERELGEGEVCKGIRKIITDVTREHFEETGENIALNMQSVLNLCAGKQTIQEFNMTKAWLTVEENKEVLDLTLESSVHGFPLSPCQLMEHANQILRKQLEKMFKGVGDHWAS
ncbi:hypothetical protein MPER_03305 [Moniliophthora perniciosa FA553]|nr:hypothetical protein MPER_03305 [Moniliophthora perniciosa FA553]